MNNIFFSLFLSAILLSGNAVHSEDLSLPPIQDTWISGLTSSNNHGSDNDLGICPVANYWIFLNLILLLFKI